MSPSFATSTRRNLGPDEHLPTEQVSDAAFCSAPSPYILTVVSTKAGVLAFGGVKAGVPSLLDGRPNFAKS